MKQRKKIIVVLIVIGVVLMFSAIYSIYNRKLYENIRYNPNNPKEAKIYEGINTEAIVFFIGLICLCSPFILKYFNNINKEKLNNIKHKILRVSKQNIEKTITVCFWGYMIVSTILVLKDIFSPQNLSQIAEQYYEIEIIIKLAIFLISRSSFEKFTSYSNIFRI